MLPSLKACEAQVGDDFHINPEEIEKKYFGVDQIVQRRSVCLAI